MTTVAFSSAASSYLSLVSGQSPGTDTTLPDGRSRKLFVGGVPPQKSWIRAYGVKPSDAVNVAFVTLQMKFGSEGKNRQKIKGAMQVKMCKDGSVRGITSTNPLHDGTWAPAYVQHTECGGQDTFLKMDNLFRKTVALTRFELAKRFKGPSPPPLVLKYIPSPFRPNSIPNLNSCLAQQLTD